MLMSRCSCLDAQRSCTSSIFIHRTEMSPRINNQENTSHHPKALEQHTSHVHAHTKLVMNHVIIMLCRAKCQPGPWFNIKMLSYQYRKSHCRDKTILRPSYLHNGISYTGKTTSLYWIRAQVKWLLGGILQPMCMLSDTYKFPDSTVHPANMGPSGADRTQVGPVLAPWTLLSGLIHIKSKYYFFFYTLLPILDYTD